MSLRRDLMLSGAAALLVAAAYGEAAARVWRVNVQGTGDVATIEEGCRAAAAGDTVLVAPGRYTWSAQGTGDVYGMVFIERDWTGFALIGEAGPAQTILDAERAGRVFFVQGYNDILIEGFTITRGRAPADQYNAGGGLIGHLSSPTLRDCVFHDNDALAEPDGMGGALWYGGVSNLRVENCRFEGNRAVYGGAVGLVNSTGDTRLVDCTFVGNSAAQSGGAIVAANFQLAVEGCLFIGNEAVLRGGGFYGVQIHPSSVARCTFDRNGAADGGGIHLRGEGELTLIRSIITNAPRGGALRASEAGVLRVGCCDLYGNAGGDYPPLPPDAVDQGGIFSANPLYCGDTTPYPHAIAGDSPCAPGRHPEGSDCGLIGAQAPWCRVDEARTLGDLKNAFRAPR